MSAVAGLAPCPVHGADALMVACASCQAWWAYREALSAATYWRDRWSVEKAKRMRLEREMGR